MLTIAKYTTISAEQPVGSVGGGKIVDGGKVFLYAGPTTAYTAKTNYLTSTGESLGSSPYTRVHVSDHRTFGSG